MTENLADVLCFIGVVLGVLLIAMWSDRSHRKLLREDAEKRREVYRRHNRS